MILVLKYLVVAILAIALIILLARVVFSLPPNKGTDSAALPPSTIGALAEALGSPAAAHAGQTGIAPLLNGADAFAARMLLADAAVSSIDAQYYIWHGDLTGYLLLDALKRAADRGVRVRLLLDDNGTSGLDREIAALDAHPMVEVRLYNPFNLRRAKLLSYGFDFFRLNRRMHNKSFTVDNCSTVLGGRNVGDEYFGTGHNALFVDLDVLAVGDIVAKVSDDFDRYWNSPSIHPSGPIVGAPGPGAPIAEGLAAAAASPQMAAYQAILERSTLVRDLTAGQLQLEWTTVVLVSDDPAKGEGAVPREDLLAVQLRRAVGNIETRFDGVSPYFVPGVAGVDTFAALERSGVAVRMLTNSMEATDVLAVHAGYAKRRKPLLSAGVKLFELRSGVAPEVPTDKPGPFGSSAASLHAKTFAVDGRRIFIGSFNFDPRSTSLNTEMGLLIDSPQLANGVHRAFDNGLGGMAWQVRQHNGDLIWADPEHPDAVPQTDEPGSNALRNLAITVIGGLPVEWLL